MIGDDGGGTGKCGSQREDRFGEVMQFCSSIINLSVFYHSGASIPWEE